MVVSPLRNSQDNYEEVQRLNRTFQDIWGLSQVKVKDLFNQSKTAALEASTDGYNLVSFNANWQPASLKGLGLFVKGRNLLNEDGRRHTSFLKDNATITGRSILAGVNFDFNI